MVRQRLWRKGPVDFRRPPCQSAAMATLTKRGAALLGAEDAAAGEPVFYEIALRHDGDAVGGFDCTVRSPSGGGFAHLYGRPLVLEIQDGPTFGVMIAHMDGDQAVLQLRS